MRKLTDEKEIQEVLVTTPTPNAVAAVAMAEMAHSGLTELWKSGNVISVVMDGSEQKGEAAVMYSVHVLLKKLVADLNLANNGSLRLDCNDLEQLKDWSGIYGALLLAAGNVELFYNKRANAMRWRLTEKGIAAIWQSAA
ncbi:hypothetical protein [Paraburkholderia sp. MM5482-R1]|uniref:hypothetical protein n=1 Tax=unclassified Paraburkholderia TaxID=2615204 RepID=UPI003D1FC724